MQQDEEQHKKDLLSEVAKNRVRDEHGHFVHEDSNSAKTEEPILMDQNQHPKQQYHSVMENIPGIHIDKTNDENTLVDLHVNNPLKKVISLLEDLKKQKAFTFDIKGSLGLAGILVVFTTFGLFGGGKILCDKGTATQIGEVKILHVKEPDESGHSWITSITQKYFNKPQPVLKNRIVLIPQNGAPLHIVVSSAQILNDIDGESVVATGSYNSCTQSLTVEDENAIELADY
jgi:hypothetical protein